MGETLTWKESAMFPILGSVMLLGLWAVLKYFGKKWITIILGVYCKYKLIAMILGLTFRSRPGGNAGCTVGWYMSCLLWNSELTRNTADILFRYSLSSSRFWYLYNYLSRPYLCRI